MRKLLILGALLIAACRSTTATPVDPANATYTIDKREVTLRNGVLEEPAAPGSASKATTRLHEKGAVGDINSDGMPDAVAVLTSSGGGSGTFYYVTVVLGTATGAGDATNAIALGDRVTIDRVQLVGGGRISVDLLDRRIGEPLTTAPSVKVTRVFQLNDRTLAEVK